MSSKKKTTAIQKVEQEVKEGIHIEVQKYEDEGKVWDSIIEEEKITDDKLLRLQSMVRMYDQGANKSDIISACSHSWNITRQEVSDSYMPYYRKFLKKRVPILSGKTPNEWMFGILIPRYLEAYTIALKKNQINAAVGALNAISKNLGFLGGDSQDKLVNQTIQNTQNITVINPEKLNEQDREIYYKLKNMTGMERELLRRELKKQIMKEDAENENQAK